MPRGRPFSAIGKPFLRFNEREVLGHAGAVSKADADARASREYQLFAARHRKLLEAEGERVSLAALEAVSRRRPPGSSQL